MPASLMGRVGRGTAADGIANGARRVVGLTTLLMLLWCILGFHSLASLFIGVSHTSQLATTSHQHRGPYLTSRLEWPTVAAARAVRGMIEEVDPGFLSMLGVEEEERGTAAHHRESLGMGELAEAVFAEVISRDSHAAVHAADQQAADPTAVDLQQQAAVAGAAAPPSKQSTNVTYGYEARAQAKRERATAGAATPTQAGDGERAAAHAGEYRDLERATPAAAVGRPSGRPAASATSTASTTSTNSTASAAPAAAAACEDEGPWACTEKGCPGLQVHCADMASFCVKGSFGDVFLSPPAGLKLVRIRDKCPKLCGQCTGGATTPGRPSGAVHAMGQAVLKTTKGAGAGAVNAGRVAMSVSGAVFEATVPLGENLDYHAPAKISGYAKLADATSYGAQARKRSKKCNRIFQVGNRGDMRSTVKPMLEELGDCEIKDRARLNEVDVLSNPNANPYPYP
eukprot:scaffold33453_cov53-Phaeocystis_antarctica.AAC.4